MAIKRIFTRHTSTSYRNGHFDRYTAKFDPPPEITVDKFVTKAQNLSEWQSDEFDEYTSLGFKDHIVEVNSAQSILNEKILGDETLVKTGAGTLIIDSSQHNYGGIRVEQGIVIVTNSKGLNGGAITVYAGARLILDIGFDLVPANSIDNNGLIDVGLGGIAIANWAVPKSTQMLYVRNQIKSGRNTGFWDGASGITSNYAVINAYRAIGYYHYSNDVIVLRYVYTGDLDLNGRTDTADLFMLMPNYYSGQLVCCWADGDIDYDDTVDFDDILLLYPNYNRQLLFTSSSVYLDDIIDMGGKTMTYLSSNGTPMKRTY